jgi:hypothetical protein
MSTEPDPYYNPTTKTITGVVAGNNILVTIVIKKENDKYSLLSQMVELVKDGGNVVIINDLGNTADNYENETFETDYDLSKEDEKGGSPPPTSSDIYTLPKANKRKIKQVYNKTLHRRNYD